MREFVAGLTAATGWAQAHPGRGGRHARATPRDYRDDLERSVPATLRLLGTGPLPEAAWDRFGAWMFGSGLLDERPDAAALVARP